MLKKIINVRNRYGIHARPSSLISELAFKFESIITINYQGKSANATSIMSLILLCVEPNNDIELEIEGADEEAAMAQMVHLFEVILPQEEWDSE